jgi:REP element-mobilizing transposase RayT
VSAANYENAAGYIKESCGRHGQFYNRRMIKGRPPRLQQIFQCYDPPLFFITICTLHRRKVDPLDTAHAAFRKYVFRGVDEFEIGLGRYVIMPDHMHFFVQGDKEFDLGKWVNGLKRAIPVAIGATNKRPLWQPGFFDHGLRNDERYAPKWEYVQQNPVRARLVDSAAEWQYQGEIIAIDRA